MSKKVIYTTVILLIAAGIYLIPVQSGILLTNLEGKPYHFFPWEERTVTVGWRHSVELTPWQETYQINRDNTLSFAETLYQSYGAGTPDTEGSVEFLSDGFVRVTGIQRNIPFYSLYYVPISNYSITDGTTIYPLKNYVPDYNHVRIQYDSITIFDWLRIKLNT
ncbi:DUF1850 domain-containing protein [Ornithinibacillus californiensis]|uniref:DUF1850 domain-containing protein n=1 Tax=Ornithinibacillus californiensis TaxID=161536 RepID=UPI00069ED930|nr:DUF1850 domain-containing protein [Ornithinibacillus californiensis]